MSTPRKVQLKPEAQQRARTAEFERRVRELYATQVRLENARTRLNELQLEQRHQHKEFANTYGPAVEDAGAVLSNVPCPDGTPVLVAVEMECDWWDMALPVRLRLLTGAADALVEDEGEEVDRG